MSQIKTFRSSPDDFRYIGTGLILLPLIARGEVRWVLILCPASLVEQWQDRMRKMFGQNFARYLTELDTPKSDFWGMNPHVVASLQTLRQDHKQRRQRLLETEPWDMVIVDEAHHLNADEKSGPTLGYELIDELQQVKKIHSMVFFTGTPHRGKDFGFLSLLKLLCGEEKFSTKKPLQGQLTGIADVMIRNNKQNVTDLKGNRLFQPLRNRPVEYSYSPEESAFYDILTQFILDGKAYASGLTSNNGRAVMLVLYAMQKLASSSVAAITKALKNRIEKKKAATQEIESLQRLLELFRQSEEEQDFDEINKLDDQLVVQSAKLSLLQDEECFLQMLIDQAEKIKHESKVKRILDILDNEFADRSVLLFTEYKATQALVMSSIINRYGNDSVVFINGEHRLDSIVMKDGTIKTLRMNREDAVERFTDGRARFLIATEAGGEGIDLQSRCHSMIHIDLPWNPMRMHQRVGRLNRYGQKHQVEIFTIRNPDTVESHIWNLLNEKIERIMLAIGQAMDEPEDLLQLVLGMTSPSFFREIFTEGSTVKRETLPQWFDSKAKSFGGQNVVDTVRELVGHCSKFDFQQVSDKIPQVDLSDLCPFFLGMLENNRRDYKGDNENGYQFITPADWCPVHHSIQERYQGILFNRQYEGKDAMQRVVGVCHKLFDTAIEQAKRYTVSVSLVPPKILEASLFVLKITDRITSFGSKKSVVVAVEGNSEERFTLLLDWNLLQVLNRLSSDSGKWRQRPPIVDVNPEMIGNLSSRAMKFVTGKLDDLDLDMRVPAVELLGVLWSGTVSAEKEMIDTIESFH